MRPESFGAHAFFRIMSNQRYSCNSLNTILLVSMVFFYAELCLGAFESKNPSPIHSAMGAVPFSVIQSSTGLLNDPTILSPNSPFRFSGSQTNLFGIKELQEFSFSMGGVVKNRPLGISVASFGNSIYSETTINWFTSKQISPAIRLGMSLNIYQLQISSYGMANAIGGKVSLRATLNPIMESIISMTNINNPTLGEIKEPLPQEISGGIIIRPNPNVIGQISFKQDLEYDISPRFGLLVKPHNQVGLAFGNVHNPSITTGGFFIDFNSFKIEFGCLSYAELGLITYQTGVSYSIRP